MKGKICGLLIITILLSSACCAFSFGDKITVTNFSYTDSNNERLETIPGNEEIFCEFDITSETEEKISYVAALLYYNGGKLVEMKTEDGILTYAGEEKNHCLFVNTEEESETPIIVTVIWDSLENREPLAPPAYFGTDENRLYSLSLNGIPFELKNDTFFFERSFSLDKGEIPENVKYIPRDLASGLSLTRNKLKYILTVSDYSEENSNEYTVSPNVSISDSKCAFAGTKVCNEAIWKVKAVPGSGNTIDLTLRRNKELFIGTSQRSFLRFNLPEIPEDFEIEEVTLTMYMSGTTPLTGIAASKLFNNWDDPQYETNEYKKEFPGPRLADEVLAASITTETGTLNGTGSWEKVVVKLDPEAIRGCDDGMLSVTLIMDYVSSNPTYKINATDDSMVPYLSFKLAE